MNEKEFNLLILPSISSMENVVDMFDENINLTKGRFNNLEFVFSDGDLTISHDGVDLKECSFVWLSSSWASRDLAYALKLYLKRHEIPFSNVEKGTSKLTDHTVFALHGIQSPNTVFVNHKETEKILPLLKKVCGYPLIVKDTKGSRGSHSEYISSESELISKLESLPKHKKYIFQRYIENEYDWGVMVANGVVVSGEKSYPCEGEFRNNTCNGASEVFVDPCDIPEEIKSMSIKASTALGLAWSRTDIIVDKYTSEPYIMEVNRFPGITIESTEVSGAYAFLASQIKTLVSPA